MAGNAMLDADYARLHADVVPGQYVLLAVSDTGSGMPPEVVRQAFEPFFSTKPDGKGSGLGLSMVHGFVKQSGGHVKIYSEPGQGTVVRLYLPRAHQGEDQPVSLETTPIAGGRETVLVVEDDDSVRATVVEMLNDLGYQILTARDAASALTVIESGAAVDLLFTDVVMPGTLRSPELARKARERLPGIAVLFTEHDMDVVFGVSDRILVLDHGRLIAEGDAASIRADPAVREIYLGTGGGVAG